MKEFALRVHPRPSPAYHACTAHSGKACGVWMPPKLQLRLPAGKDGFGHGSESRLCVEPQLGEITAAVTDLSADMCLEDEKMMMLTWQRRRGSMRSESAPYHVITLVGQVEASSVLWRLTQPREVLPG